MSLRNRSNRYRSLCAPTTKTGTLTEDLRSIFECSDDQDTEALEARFSRGAECLRRRIEEMTFHGTNTHKNRNTRRRHLIPAKLTYAFAKNCLRRYADESEIDEFEQDINRRMSRLYGRRYSIENSIRNLAPNSRTLRRAAALLGNVRRNNTIRRTYTRKNSFNSNNLNNIRSRGYNTIRVTLTR